MVFFFIALIKSLKAATTQKRGRGRKLGWEGPNKAAALTECTMTNPAEISCLLPLTVPAQLLREVGVTGQENGLFTSGAQGPRGRLAETGRVERNRT